MKAIRVTQFGGPEVLEVQDIDVPQIQSATQVLVEIRAAGVNPVDTYIRSGTYARLPQRPYTPGSDGAGVVAAVGEAVRHIQVGDRVYGGWPITGTYAQFALYEADWIYPLPSKLSFEQGAGIFIPYSTAHRALFEKAQAQPGEWVLIHGATGAVGLAAVQLAHQAGLRIIGTGGTEAGRALLQAQGVEVVLNHHDPDCVAHILAATEGRGINVILEMLANVNLGKDLPLLAFGGRVVVIGNRGTVEINPRDLMAKESTITAVNLFSTPPETLHHIQAQLSPGLRDGTLLPIVAHTSPLAEAATVHRQILEPGALGNWVLIP
ncbi:quinone oxidoreductase [Leptolyngbya sp. BL0902]|uniref:NADPH:quinone reductase n=1 Tax=Leptolyngbya sp. BL0902 TaxID=1115757 RepID=UPI0018E6F36A|nr:NADPH:quinone reductase [Leptolyngbya sp. BL0902]QQE66499.1 quinone oxidoreductase [Leptolyngbya sp. BL0902]